MSQKRSLSIYSIHKIYIKCITPNPNKLKNFRILFKMTCVRVDTDEFEIINERSSSRQDSKHHADLEFDSI